ncbi:hypothetical protein GCM10008995_11810 [Halobellus salinus]|uniref:Uncharacterized protein n=1 Tax=Halobellus salinus TaxID=931585 RepID=A0A830ERQ8_9EURY|nr:hypothetical protein [Halobellus salinus]GGJ03660.1 hypothetical protein GCM10008995_11810 [Halobellus salinus]SMP21084.1 hypothetical protein SAMN06265347_10844 [Halobellus salinus]
MGDGTPGPDGNGRTAVLRDAFDRLFRDGRTNAVIAWALVGVLVGVFGDSVLDTDYGWTLVTGFVGGVVLLPPVAHREWRVMLPWELLVLSLLPILVRGLFGGTLGTFATYLSLAALALLVVVELHTFTTLQVTHWFAVVLVVLTTLAAVAAWTVFRWNADTFLGTDYLVDNETLMMEWLYVTLAGVVAGLLFDGYFRRRDQWLWRAIRRMVRR